MPAERPGYKPCLPSAPSVKNMDVATFWPSLSS